MDQLDIHFGIMMSEGTICPIGTFVEFARVEGTVFGFESLWMVKLLNSVVGVRTLLLANFEWT